MDSLNLIRMARMMRDNQVFENGKKIPKKAPDFFIGAVENPFAPPYDYRPLRLAKKIVAGAQFIQTQLIFNVDRFREFMKRVVDLGLHEKVAILAGVGPISRCKVAEYMKNEVAGMDVPDWVLKRMEGLSKEDQQKAGLDICWRSPTRCGRSKACAACTSWPSTGPRPCRRCATAGVVPAAHTVISKHTLSVNWEEKMKRLNPVPSDLEIAQAAELKPILDVAASLGLGPDDLDLYGKYKAKVHLDVLEKFADRPQGKYIDVTAITPTPLGEGKTTTTIGLTQGLGVLGKSVVAASASRRRGRPSASRAARPAAATARSCRWRTSTCT